MKALKTALSLLMVFCMILSFGTVAFADGEEPSAGGEQQSAPTAVITQDVKIEEGQWEVQGQTHRELTVTPDDPAISVTPASGGSPTVITIDANITPPSTGGTSSAVGFNVYDQVETQVTITGDISTTRNNSFNVYADANHLGKVDVTVKGNITAEGTVSCGAIATTYKGTSSSITVEKNVTVNGSNSSGVSASTTEEGTAKITVTGDVIVTNDDYRDAGGDAISSDAYIGGTAVVTVGTEDKASTVSGAANGIGIGIKYNTSPDTTSSVTVYGDVEGRGENGISVDNAAGTATVEVKEDSSGNGGDVTGKKAGVEIKGKADVTIEGTLKVADGGTPVLLGDAVAATDTGNINITVWKVEVDGKDKVTDVVSSLASTDEGKAAAAAVQENINYIIKVEQPKKGGSISATGTTKNGNYETAHAGDTVTMKVTVEDGYVLDGAFNGVDGSKVELTEKDGCYYITVPKDGGVYLSVNLSEKQKDEPVNPTPKPDTKSQPVTIEFVSSAVKFTFNLNGGKLDGETGKIIKWYVPGTTVKLPAAPTKDGCTFAGWQTKVNGEKKVFEAGEKFEVTGAQSFTALWD